MNISNIKIKEVIESLATHNSEYALKQLFNIYASPLLRYIFMFVKSKEIAEELLSDVFFAIWQQRKELLEIDNFKAYIYKVAKFNALNYLRSKSDIKTLGLDDIQLDLFTATQTTPEDKYISQEVISNINQAIRSLPPKCQLAFKLIREDHFSYKEVADHLEISVKTVENHIATANKKIKEQLLRLK